MIRFGRASLPIFCGDVLAQLGDHLVARLVAALGRDEGDDRLAGVLVRLADHRRLGDLGVRDERRLDLHRREPVAGDVDHVVDPADDPEVAVLVAARGVADQVGVAAVAVPVGLDEALALPVERARHRRPGPGQHEGAAALLDLVARRSRRSPPRSREAAPSPSPAWSSSGPAAGAIMIAPVSVCHQVSTIGQRPPPMCSWYQSQARGLIGSPTVPSRRSEERSCASGCSRPPLHAGADRGRRRVEDRHAVALDDLPPAVLGRVVGRALVHDAGRAVGERPVDDVGVAGDPADVGAAPVDVVVLEVEDELVGGADLGQVAARGVQDPLRLRRSSPRCRG